MTLRRPVRAKRLFPAALVAAATGSCTPAPPCDDSLHRCWPDGGMVCPSGCTSVTANDGGLEVDDQGRPVCLC